MCRLTCDDVHATIDDVDATNDDVDVTTDNVDTIFNFEFQFCTCKGSMCTLIAAGAVLLGQTESVSYSELSYVSARLYRGRFRGLGGHVPPSQQLMIFTTDSKVRAASCLYRAKHKC